VTDCAQLALERPIGLALNFGMLTHTQKIFVSSESFNSNSWNNWGRDGPRWWIRNIYHLDYE
jgi:hypothetical protein